MWILLTGQFVRHAADKRAVTSIEYAMIACGIIVAIVGSVLSTGNQLPAIFGKVSAALHQF